MVRPNLSCTHSPDPRGVATPAHDTLYCPCLLFISLTPLPERTPHPRAEPAVPLTDVSQVPNTEPDAQWTSGLVDELKLTG